MVNLLARITGAIIALPNMAVNFVVGMYLSYLAREYERRAIKIMAKDIASLPLHVRKPPN